MSEIRSLFDPRSISGCQLWLDGADPNGNGIQPTVGASISTWRDKSAAAANGNLIGTAPTFASGGGLLFGNSGAYNTSYSASLTNETLFMVFRYTRANAQQGIVAQTGDGGRTITITAGASSAAFESSVYNVAFGAVSPSTTVSQNRIGIGVLVTTNSNMAIFYNGTSFGTPTTVTITAGRTSVIGGAYNAGSINTAQYLGGTLFEIVGYNVALNSTQRQQVEGYLAWKWGVQASLPANHPFFSVNPYSAILPSFLPTAPLQTRIATIVDSAFQPTQISGCAMWLDGADPNGNGVLPSNGATIATWTDKSGNGNNATGGTSPTFNSTGINQLGVVSFNGSSQFLNSQDLYGNRSFVVFSIVRRQGNISGQTGFLSGSTQATNQNLHLVWRTNTNLAMGFFSNDLDFLSFSNYTGNTSTEPAYLIVWFYTPGARQIYVNGTLVASDTNTTNLTSSSGMVLGRYFTTFWNGFLGELITFNGTMTAVQRQQVEGYLVWKWGLSLNLATNHPAYNPLFSRFFPTVRPSLLAESLFSPPRISGCQLWLDAFDPSTLTLSGVNVTQWRDKSGNSRHLGVGSGNTTYSSTSNSVNLNSSHMFVTSVVDLTNITAFFVVVSPTGVNNQTVISGRPNNAVNWNSTDGFGFYVDVNQIRFYGQQPAGQNIQNTPTTTNRFLTSVTATSSGSLNSWQNGVTASTGTMANSRTNTAQGFAIGGEWQGTVYSNFTSVTNIFEVLVFNVVLTTPQRQQIEGYLAWKWGLQANLPSTHPFVRFPPSP